MEKCRVKKGTFEWFRHDCCCHGSEEAGLMEEEYDSQTKPYHTQVSDAKIVSQKEACIAGSVRYYNVTVVPNWTNRYTNGIRKQT
jgi:hypothetical protein